jgi:hypothetical protein
MKRLFFLLAVTSAAACGDVTTQSPPHTVASVKFRMESPFCGATLKFAVTLFVDSTSVGTDSLADGQISRVFTTTPGPHHLYATSPAHFTFTGDTTVTLVADSTFTTRVNAYCS